MRDYSQPRYDIDELAAAFNGVCKCLGKDEYCCGATIPELGSHISSLANSCGTAIAPTGDVGIAGVNLQSLIDYLITNGVKSREQLRVYIDAELSKLPAHPLINYFVF